MVCQSTTEPSIAHGDGAIPVNLISLSSKHWASNEDILNKKLHIIPNVINRFIAVSFELGLCSAIITSNQFRKNFKNFFIIIGER